jgi:hypothetical protein
VALPEAAAGRDVLEERADAGVAVTYRVEASGYEIVRHAGLQSASQMAAVDRDADCVAESLHSGAIVAVSERPSAV